MASVVAAFFVAAFLVDAVFLVVDFLVVVFLADEAEVLRGRRFVGPWARFCASRSNAVCGSMLSTVYDFGMVRFVVPSVMYVP